QKDTRQRQLVFPPGWLPTNAQTTTFLLSYEELAQNPARDIRPRREKVTSYLGKSHALQLVRARQHIGPALSKQQIVTPGAVAFHSVPYRIVTVRLMLRSTR